MSQINRYSRIHLEYNRTFTWYYITQVLNGKLKNPRNLFLHWTGKAPSPLMAPLTLRRKNAPNSTKKVFYTVDGCFIGWLRTDNRCDHLISVCNFKSSTFNLARIYFQKLFALHLTAVHMSNFMRDIRWVSMLGSTESFDTRETFRRQAGGSRILSRHFRPVRSETKKKKIIIQLSFCHKYIFIETALKCLFGV